MKGLGASPGIAIGKIFLYKGVKLEIERRHIKNFNLELDRFNRSIEKAKDEIVNLYNRTLKNMGEEEADIFTAHMMILQDPEFIKEIEVMVKGEAINVEWAIKETTNRFISLFEHLRNGYSSEKVADLKDISTRLLRILLNKRDTDLLSIDEESIIVTRELTPSDIVAINRQKIKGIVTELGGRASHTSIMARTLGIPTIVGFKDLTNQVNHGDNIIIDGDKGEVILNPTGEEIKAYEIQQKNNRKLQEKLKQMIGKETITRDGYEVKILGNICIPSDVDKVLERDGEGIGLFRSEFLYTNRNHIPTENSQFEIYKKVAMSLLGKPLVIRTLDAGGDKEISCLNLPEEKNSSLGYKGLRIGLDRPEILKTQLRAIYRASYYGNIKMMFPMISSIEEIRSVKLIAKEVRESLESQNIPFSENVKIGMMVEVPAVAIHARAFAREIDFFSIGTNDLIQYTTAADRSNQSVSKLYNQYHPAVLRLIKMVIDGGHEEGIPVGICGEMAADRKLVPILIGMGLDELSMGSEFILNSRYQIRSTLRKEIEVHIDRILNLSTAGDVESYIDENIL